MERLAAAALTPGDRVGAGVDDDLPGALAALTDHGRNYLGAFSVPPVPAMAYKSSDGL
jgi:hypothetical protein